MVSADVVPPSGATPVTLSEVLATEAFAGAVVLAGRDGLGRLDERLTVMEVPNIQPWAKPREFLLTSAYPIRDRLDDLVGLVGDLDDAGLAGLGIKLGRYLEALPPGVGDVADERGFPIVQLPPGITFDELLTEAFTVILNRHAEKLARSERIHRAFLQTVLQGEGLREIVRDLAGLLGCPNAIVSPKGRVLASIHLDELSIDPHLPLEIDVTAGRARSGDREMTCVAVPISAGTHRHGHVVALSASAPPTDDLMALESAATVAALTLTKEREVRAVEDKYRSDLMHELLHGTADEADACRRATGFAWDLDRMLTVLVIRGDDGSDAMSAEDLLDRQPLWSSLHRLIVDRDPAAAIVHFTHEVVILTRAFPADARREATAFARRLQDEALRSTSTAVSVGVSRPVDTISNLPRGYEQASRALIVGRRVSGRGAVRHFDDLGAYRLLSLVDDPAELRAFASEVLGELDADTDTAADLRRTLQVWLDSGGNVAETARRLHFHYHSIRYRLAKVEELVGPFGTDGQLRLDLQLALLVRSMHGMDP